MCGIVGYSGKSDAVSPVLEGLSRLEYRGYDSAGISMNIDGKLCIFKKEGKLDNLKNFLKEKSELSSTIGIGHTRWATHGKVNDTNAHPHGNEDFSIVHNGIIENANVLREELKQKGYQFKSETDSETFLVKLSDEFKQSKDIEQAIIDTFKSIEGNSAFVVIAKNSHKIYSIKRSAPLVCGVNEESGDVYVSSDPYALIGFTTKIYFPGDSVLCIADHRKANNHYSFLDLNRNETKDYTIQQKQMSLNTVSKGKYEHFMLKEIFEQPELVNKLFSIYSEDITSLNEMTKSRPEMVHIIACGTALHAGLVIKDFLERKNRIRVNSDFASEFRYKEPLICKKDVGLFISQSGETADTLACQELCVAQDLKTYSIVNVEGSTLYRSCDYNLLLHAGAEIGVASTKAFTQMALVGYILSNAYLDEPKDLKSEFELLSQAITLILNREEEIKKIARDIYNYKGFIFTGRREQYPIALEGALKLKEIAYVHAEGYAAGELKHGPIALFDESMVNIAIVTKDLYEKTLSNAQEVKARKGVMVILGEGEDSELSEISDFYFGIDYLGLTDLKPLVTNVVLQLLSYHIAKFKGTDIDKPRNLAKSVTVE
ncbi:MAG: glutamine--fructose-6-phosphate transaminase (isomerizing) [Bacteriovoracaceae bacterium]|jgi:glucosamine--fructose-6-phosphate aminotransferase (isomerizing)|nr:glutamine--fructose-6-phosphate transaminase (isomerizing) [Halobacteriovoraceae bacterium]MDP7321378.1 glutamine--fructose-6-phosphate transaminase (isomerizing) [Bacteriovoracaceae bacterium]